MVRECVFNRDMMGVPFDNLTICKYLPSWLIMWWPEGSRVKLYYCLHMTIWVWQMPQPPKRVCKKLTWTKWAWSPETNDQSHLQDQFQWGCDWTEQLRTVCLPKVNKKQNYIVCATGTRCSRYMLVVCQPDLGSPHKFRAKLSIMQVRWLTFKWTWMTSPQGTSGSLGAKPQATQASTRLPYPLSVYQRIYIYVIYIHIYIYL